MSVRPYKDGESDRIERTLSFGNPLTQKQRIKLPEIAGKTAATKQFCKEPR